jgi:hypothetical protein
MRAYMRARECWHTRAHMHEWVCKYVRVCVRADKLSFCSAWRSQTLRGALSQSDTSASLSSLQDQILTWHAACVSMTILHGMLRRLHAESVWILYLCRRAGCCQGVLEAGLGLARAPHARARHGMLHVHRQ